jgi:hypothetical protein
MAFEHMKVLLGECSIQKNSEAMEGINGTQSSLQNKYDRCKKEKYALQCTMKSKEHGILLSRYHRQTKARFKSFWTGKSSWFAWTFFAILAIICRPVWESRSVEVNKGKFINGKPTSHNLKQTKLDCISTMPMMYKTSYLLNQSLLWL